MIEKEKERLTKQKQKHKPHKSSTVRGTLELEVGLPAGPRHG